MAHLRGEKPVEKQEAPTERDRKVEKLLKAVADGDIHMVMRPAHEYIMLIGMDWFAF